MADLLNSTHGFEWTENAEEADVLLLNTCSIREKAQEKVFAMLGRWRLLKEKNPSVIIGVGGCVASQEGELIRSRAPCVDVVFGPQTLHRLPEMINHVQGTRSPVVDISFPEIEKFDRLPEPRAEGPTAFVSIMEGCNKYCTFCVVPYTRGEEVSRPSDDVLFEIAQLAAQGVREVNLLGQNVNAYRGATHDGEICSFAELLRLVAAIDGIDRIRFTTSHPIEFTDDIIAVYEDTPELVSFLHLPVQSGSDRILTMMKRAHTALEYKAIIRKLRKARPAIQLSSDFIVGFPGESQADFEQTMNLIADVNFDVSFSFIYSSRPGTRRRTWSTTSAKKRKTAAVYSAGSHQPAGAAVQPPHARHRPAHSGGGHLAQKRDGTGRAHGVQPCGKLRGHARHDRPVRRRGNYRGADQHPAWRSGAHRTADGSART